MTAEEKYPGIKSDTRELVRVVLGEYQDIMSPLRGTELDAYDWGALLRPRKLWGDDWDAKVMVQLLRQHLYLDQSLVVHDTTALVAAVEKGHYDIVSALLGKGVDVDKVVHGTTALVAAMEGMKIYDQESIDSVTVTEPTPYKCEQGSPRDHSIGFGSGGSGTSPDCVTVTGEGGKCEYGSP